MSLIFLIIMGAIIAGLMLAGLLQELGIIDLSRKDE